MQEDGYFNHLITELTPTPEADRSLEQTVLQVESALVEPGVPSHRFGSFPRQTRLAEHPEVDLGVDLVGLSSLERLERELVPLLPAARFQRPDGMLGLTLGDHHLDLVPSVPLADVWDKRAFAALGTEHVRWVLGWTRPTLRAVVLALKAHRERTSDLQGLSPLAWEVLVVTLLGSEPAQSAELGFAAVISALAHGVITSQGDLSQLPDPVRPELDLLARLTEPDRVQMQRVAERTLRHIEHENWSQVFSKGTPKPSPAVNLGGSVLA